MAAADAAAVHLDGMAILHQQLVPAWQHPDDVAALDYRVHSMIQHGRYAEALSWLDEVHGVTIVMSSQHHNPRQVKCRIDAPPAERSTQQGTPATNLVAANTLGSAHPDLQGCLLEVVALRTQLQARDTTIATLQQHLKEARAEVLGTLPFFPTHLSLFAGGTARDAGPGARATGSKPQASAFGSSGPYHCTLYRAAVCVCQVGNPPVHHVDIPPQRYLGTAGPPSSRPSPPALLLKTRRSHPHCNNCKHVCAIWKPRTLATGTHLICRCMRGCTTCLPTMMR